MGEWWGAAELGVSRSGAGSVAEAWANRVACVFLPYPYHRDEHQRWNAEPLERAGGAVIEKDMVKATANAEGAGRAIAGLMRDGARRDAMRAALARMGPADGASEAARRLLALVTD
jgi:UDP-N-acetylglucosamine--N-acetylmuramyl-(pentapeptide) pyrophosphoryl-undecaprenol N-acetylglucosamine transferase